MLSTALRGLGTVRHHCLGAGGIGNARHRGLGAVRRSNKSATADSTHAPSSFAARHPFAAQMLVATTKTSVCDVLVQLKVEGKEWNGIDWSRNAVFVAFGAVYLGGVQVTIWAPALKAAVDCLPGRFACTPRCLFAVLTCSHWRSDALFLSSLPVGGLR